MTAYAIYDCILSYYHSCQGTHLEYTAVEMVRSVLLSCLSLVFLLARSVLHQCYLEKMKEVFWCFRGQVLKHLHNQ